MYYVNFYYVSYLLMPHGDQVPTHRWRSRASTSTKTPSNGKLACPFFKHNKHRYRMSRTCCGPGWDEIHRLKLVENPMFFRHDRITASDVNIEITPREHLYRRHCAPRYQCARCLQDFKTIVGLSNHQREVEPCQLAVPDGQDDFINKDQEEQLRGRGKNAPLKADQEKWADIYRILFPHEDVPSPCTPIRSRCLLWVVLANVDSNRLRRGRR